MSLYIGALGLETFDDAIEDASNTLVNRIVSDINYTSNYVLATSNILVKRINDTSNILATRINDTSNVLATRIKILEGSEGSPGDISLGIPAIPSTGGFATAAAIAALTAASYLGGVSVLTMVTSLEIKVDSNKAQADLIGGWSSNYSDKVGVWGSNYVLTTSNILIGRINDTSNYVWNTSNILIGRINDTSNYVGTTSNILVGRINDTSNYVWNTSNILIGRINDTSNYVWNTSNILIGRINDTSNYVGTTSNILVGRINDTSNYVWNTSNILIGRINDTSNYIGTTSNILVGRINDTSNYIGTTSNILVGRINDTSNYVARINTELNTSMSVPTTALGVRVDNTSNYVFRVNTELNTSDIALGVRVDNTSNYVARINTELTTADIALGVRVDNTSNYVFRVNTELTTADTALGVRVDNTSNYVARINTELNTADTALGVRVDNTSNYVSTYKPTTAGTADTANAITATNLLSSLYTADFLVLNDKIRINKTLEPLGYYQINIFGPGNRTWTSTFYNYSDRTRAYDTNTTFFTDGVGTTPYKYNVTGAIRNSRVYYNHGDKIMFKNWGNGLADVSSGGASHLYQLYKMRTEYVDGFGPTGSQEADGYYKQFSWDGGQNELRDWRAYSAWTPSPAQPTNPYTWASIAGSYNEQLAYTLQSGWKYMLVRIPYVFQQGTFCDTPLIIHVNDPYYNPDQSYIPPAVTLSSTQAVKNKRSIPLSKQVGSYEASTPNTETTSSLSLDYELSTGFNYDETSNLIKVFDGNYNNLTNKPSLITTTDINNTSNYVSRINSDLTTVIGGKAPTSHTHTIANITNLQTTLDGKAPTTHTHVIGDITNLQTTLDGKAPTTHTHTIANITNLQTTLDGKAPTTHTHVISDITNLQTTLDGKAPTTHTHTIANITNLQTTLDGKAPTTHTHVIGDITNLQTTLDGKAPTSHTHTIANITNLQTTLDGKAPTTHTHVIGDITNLQTTLDGKAPTSHTHIIGDVTGLQTALSGLQAKIISTAGQLIIGNGDGITTTSTGLTWTSGTSLLTTTNLAVSTQATITQLLTTGQTADMFILQNNATNSLRFQQVFNVVNDNKWILNQKSNNIDYPLFNFRNGKICVGTSANPAYMLDVVGDINITGEFRKNATIYKPANAVLADSATTAVALATSRNIAGVAFNGTADVVVDYVAINNKPLTLTPTTTNFVLTSGYNLLVPGNVGVGTSLTVANILQVGAGGRLRISNGTTDYTTIGTLDVDGATNTSIVISGTTRSTNAGNIQYLATASGGSHIFYTASATTRMTISSSGVNVNNDLGVSGNVGIGVAPSVTYKVNVSGSLNATSVFVNGSAISGSQWTTSGTSIYYNAGANQRMRIWDNGAVGIQGEWNPAGAGTGGYMIANNLMNSAGSLTIGNINQNYGGGTGGVGNISGFMMECFNSTEMSVHDYGQFIHSFMYYANSTFTIGRNMGWGSANVVIPANLNVGSISTNSIQSSGTDGPLNIDPNYSTNNYVRIYDRLVVEGSFYTSGTIQSGGAFYFASSLWHKCNASNDRLYFAPNASTYIKAGNVFGFNIVFRNGGDTNIGYFQDTLFYCYGPYNLSDRRIKRDIVEINDETALNMLLLVQPTTYYYRDEARNKGNGKVYGFIAQQIKEVIPDAVSITKDIIANIYKTCLVYNKREIYHSISQDVAIDTEVQILNKQGGEGKRYKIKEIYDDYFVIDEDIEGDDCFVFGYCVDDLHGLDKSYIYTLNVCATQELHRRIEAQNVIIKSQDDRIKELEAKMVDILKYLSL